MFVPAFSRSVGYLGHAWCRSDSQILARNGVFVVTVACKSKTTHQSELRLDEASAVCQARGPRRRHMRICSENLLCRLWDFERPRPQIPIPRHRKDFVVMFYVLLCLQQGARPRGARASRRLLAIECAGGGRTARRLGAPGLRAPSPRAVRAVSARRLRRLRAHRARRAAAARTTRTTTTSSPGRTAVAVRIRRAAAVLGPALMRAHDDRRYYNRYTAR